MRDFELRSKILILGGNCKVATYYMEPSRTFSEFLLIPNLTTKACTPANVKLEDTVSQIQ